VHDDDRHIEADNLLILCALPSIKEVMMTSNRNLIIGAVIVVVVIGAYFVATRYNATPPQSTPAATTEPKK
jgi:hypothetical protein